MRKFLFVLLILLLCVAMYFIVWYGIPNLEFVNTYTEVQAVYEDYQSTLQILKNKNDNELPAVLSKLDSEYSKDSGADLDNVIKQYDTNKEKYEYYLALEKANEMIDEADIYDIEYIWTTIGGYAKNNYLEMAVDIVKSEADLESDDYIMCNLDFDIVGQYQSVISFLEDIETDSSLGFQINDFFSEGYNSKARNQSKTQNMDTDNIPSDSEIDDEDLEYSVSSTSTNSNETTDSHALDIKASFRIYNIPINKRTITNVKSDSDATTELDESDTTTELDDSEEEISDELVTE